VRGGGRIVRGTCWVWGGGRGEEWGRWMIVEMAVTSSSLFPRRKTQIFSSPPDYRQIFTSEHAVGEHLIVDFLLEHSRFLYCTRVHSRQISILFRTSEERNDHSISGQFLSCVFSYALYLLYGGFETVLQTRLWRDPSIGVMNVPLSQPSALLCICKMSIP